MNTITLRNGLRTSCLSQHLSTSKPSTILFQQSSLDFLLPSLSTKTYQNSINQLRNASTATATKPAPKPPIRSPEPSSASLPPKHDTLNAPLTTLPAPINTPSQTPGQSKFSYLLALGKSYISFYKTGIVNVKNNFVASQSLKDTISKAPYNGSALSAARAHVLTRAEFQLLRRNSHDVKRVPLFGLVMLVCGEFTPLVVIAVSNVVPWTCRIPKQIAGDRKKLEERRAISFRNLTMEAPKERDVNVATLHRMQAIHISWSLGLSSRVWDFLGGQFPGLPTGMLQRKVAKRVDYLNVDDELIRKHGGVSKLSVEELKMACVERGIDVLERSDDAIKKDLAAWMESVQQAGVVRLLLTRPAAWPSKGAARPERRQ